MTGGFKLVRCGCGGKAVAIGDADNNIYFVKCDKCWISTNLFHSKAEAITAWNKAMSGAKNINAPCKFATDINVGDKIAKFKQDGKFLRCEKCNHIVDSGYKYCQECGSRLEWNG